MKVMIFIQNCTAFIMGLAFEAHNRMGYLFEIINCFYLIQSCDFLSII